MSAITKTLTGSSTTIEASNFTYNTNGDTTGETTTTYSTETQNGTSFDVRTSLTKAYSYDYTNMMSSATVNQSIDAKISGSSDPYTNSASDSASDTYIYNGDGQRVKKITDGVTTKYYYTGSVVLYTADADNNKISGNIATPSGQIIATRDYANATNSDGSANTFANNYYFYHYDIRGSVTTLLKPDATIEQGYSYDEYGNTKVENSASLFHNEMSYTGAISDSTTGLSYMNARYYNPATGTFTSQDTYYGSAYSPWTQHLYSYTGGNPVNYTDPTGHRFVEGTEIGGHVKSVRKSSTSFKTENEVIRTPFISIFKGEQFTNTYNESSEKIYIDETVTSYKSISIDGNIKQGGSYSLGISSKLFNFGGATHTGKISFSINSDLKVSVALADTYKKGDISVTTTMTIGSSNSFTASFGKTEGNLTWGGYVKAEQKPYQKFLTSCVPVAVLGLVFAPEVILPVTALTGIFAH